MLHLDTAAQERLLGRTVCEVLTPGDRLRLRGQRALVTGAGGSVGSELSRQLAAAGVARLTLMDHSEYALFRIESAIREAFPQVQIVPLLGDVSRRSDVRASCRVGEPHVVYHAAAYKHVTYAETAIVQALRVNALGAAEMARAARDAGARFVLISSDKAAEPRSVMGATKRFAEQVVLNEASGTFRPIVVRFGNILASSGSVAEIMLTRARAGLPLPITDPRATRYFMTAAEAVSLVLKTDVVGRRPEIFWLDMGEPVPIGDLAARIADLVRREGGPAVSTVVIGLRPGEKTHEELTSQGLSMHRTAHSRVLSARQRPVPPALVQAALNGAVRACTHGNAPAALHVLTALVSDYVPSAVALASVSNVQRRTQVSAA
jgi:FlaA1/EpsC-like NDP-sugar epimerase